MISAVLCSPVNAFTSSKVPFTISIPPALYSSSLFAFSALVGRVVLLKAPILLNSDLRRINSGTMNLPNPPVGPRTKTDLRVVILDYYSAQGSHWTVDVVKYELEIREKYLFYVFAQPYCNPNSELNIPHDAFQKLKTSGSDGKDAYHNPSQPLVTNHGIVLLIDNQ